jgi:hypothetical protein
MVAGLIKYRRRAWMAGRKREAAPRGGFCSIRKGLLETYSVVEGKRLMKLILLGAASL